MDDIETICAHSYRNFHTKGFDYLCLTRTPELTRKVYFFEGDLAKLPELVMPHNHRYPFVTTVLAGAVRNKVYVKIDPAKAHPASIQAYTADGAKMPAFDRFDYLTPLNGGGGFTWAGEDFLFEQPSTPFTRHQHYRSYAASIHTLDIRCEGTVIMLEQLADEVALDVPTQAWRRVGDRTPPSLDGLYDRMTSDHARMRIGQFLDLIGNRA
jgi:hypothetical protein